MMIDMIRDPEDIVNLHLSMIRMKILRFVKMLHMMIHITRDPEDIVNLSLPRIRMKILRFGKILHTIIHIIRDRENIVIPMDIRMTALASNRKKCTVPEKIDSRPLPINR